MNSIDYSTYVCTAILLSVMVCNAQEKAPVISLRTDWIDPEKRLQIDYTKLKYENQDGETGKFNSLIDRPVLLTFFYTRCQNNYKCSAALTQFARLQLRLRQTGLDKKVRLVGITFEPTFDDAQRLKRFGSDRRLQFTKDAQLLRLDAAQTQSLVKALKVPVSFSGNSVNIHGIGLHVLDSQGRLARQYHTLMWDNEQVIQDAQQLLQDGI